MKASYTTASQASLRSSLPSFSLLLSSQYVSRLTQNLARALAEVLRGSSLGMRNLLAGKIQEGGRIPAAAAAAGRQSHRPAAALPA